MELKNISENFISRNQLEYLISAENQGSVYSTARGVMIINAILKKFDQEQQWKMEIR